MDWKASLRNSNSLTEKPTIPKNNLCELREPCCFHIPSFSAAQRMVIRTEDKTNFSVQIVSSLVGSSSFICQDLNASVFQYVFPFTSPPLLSFPLSPH